MSDELENVLEKMRRQGRVFIDGDHVTLTQAEIENKIMRTFLSEVANWKMYMRKGEGNAASYARQMRTLRASANHILNNCGFSQVTPPEKDHE